MPNLAALIRAKYPGAYDDVSDADLEKSVIAKHPEYADLAAKPQAAAAPADNRTAFGRMVDTALADNPALPAPLRATQALLRIAKDHPVGTGATLGGALATGGTSLLPQLGLAALGAAGGAGYGMLAKGAMSGDVGTSSGNAKEMAQDAAVAAAGEGIGQAAAGGVKAVAKGAYRYALAPEQRVLAKYGDVAAEGLGRRVPVNPDGIAAVQAQKTAAQAAKDTALEAAPNVDVDAIAEAARRKLAAKATALKDAGELPEAATLDGQIDRFQGRHAGTTASRPPVSVQTDPLPDSVDAAIKANSQLGMPQANQIPTAVFGGDNPAAVEAARQIGPLANLVPRSVLGTSQVPGSVITFGDGTPATGMTAKALDTIKGTVDDRLGGAFQKMRQMMPLTTREEGRLALSSAARDTLSDTVPGYQDLNKEIMTTTGLGKALNRRVNGSGANQGLENIASAYGLLSGKLGAAAARVGVNPSVLSQMAIFGQHAAAPLTPDAMRTALLGLMAQNQPDQQ